MGLNSLQHVHYLPWRSLLLLSGSSGASNVGLARIPSRWSFLHPSTDDYGLICVGKRRLHGSLLIDSVTL